MFFSVSMSLDGLVAPGSREDLMGPQWMELQQWIFPQRFFRERLKLGEGGEEGRDNDIVRETFERIESAPTRWRAVTAPHLVALVRAGAVVKNGTLIERSGESAGGDQHVA